LAQLVLRQKGVVLDSILEDRSLAISATTDPEGRAKLEEIAVLRSKLAKMAYDDNQKNEASQIQEQIGQIQRSLSTRANIGGRVRQSADITIDAILPSLSKDSVLVDFIRFSDPKLKGDEPDCYGAVIVAGDGSPTFVRIDGAIAIDTAIDALRTAIVENNKAEVEKQTRFLSEKLWQPIAWQFPEGTRQVFLCPEAKLNFLSFSALDEGDGVFVAEKYSITYLGSSRDLARRPSDEKSKTLAIFANPAFDESGATSRATKDMVAMRAGEADTFGAIVLPPLPGTETEGKTLEATASKAGWQARSLTGSDATETSVRQTEKPGVLHLATHGFYLNTTVSSPSNDSRGMSITGASDEKPAASTQSTVDPMRASGVALAGAQQTLKLWS
jgi:CHAT domain-containing protein